MLAVTKTYIKMTAFEICIDPLNLTKLNFTKSVRDQPVELYCIAKNHRETSKSF